MTNDITILVVEEDEGVRKLIQFLLNDSGYKQLKTAANAAAGLQLFEQSGTDICIIDIDLGKNNGDGIALAQKIREQSPDIPLILITSQFTEETYLRCRNLVPSSFLSKELSHLKLVQAIDLALLRKATPQPTPPTGEKSRHFLPDNYFFKVGDEYKSIPITKIDYFYAAEKHTFAKVADRNYPTNVQLKTLELELRGLFVRTHKTYLVNISKITDISPSDNSLIINHQTLPIGYAYRKPLFEQLFLLK